MEGDISHTLKSPLSLKPGHSTLTPYVIDPKRSGLERLAAFLCSLYQPATRYKTGGRVPTIANVWFDDIVHDAPAIARGVFQFLYALSSALFQVQQSILYNSLVAVAEDEQMKALQDCSVSCTTAFNTAHTKVDSSHLAASDQERSVEYVKDAKVGFTSKKSHEMQSEQLGPEKDGQNIISYPRSKIR